ncbi:MAG: PEP-CTERM sorting domain-containing protein [Armatimonadetes bacterium]|nr:PEP-CTERM sorting domain-containing protein [Armatimonadota bacterium]
MNARLCALTIVTFLSTAAVSLADYPTLLTYYYDGDEWHYHYTLTVEGGVPQGYWWAITNLADIHEVGTPAPAGDWGFECGSTWVRWTYLGDELPDVPDDYVFATFDIASAAPPAGGRPWETSSGYHGTIIGPAPEPATTGLLLLGLGAIGGTARIRRRKD